MIVKLLVGITGTRNGQTWPPRGGTIDLPDGEAQQMIAAGMAEDAHKTPSLKAKLTRALSSEVH